MDIIQSLLSTTDTFSFRLVGILFILMIANQLVGTSYGAIVEGFKAEKLKVGLWKTFTTFLGYAVIVIAANYTDNYIPGSEYLSGILLEPIAGYFSKIIEKLKVLISTDVSKLCDGRNCTEQQEEKKDDGSV